MKKIHLTCVSLIGTFHLRWCMVLSGHTVAVGDDMLALCIIRSWTGKETTRQTSSRPPTLGFVKPSSQMHRRTPLCLAEHSRTKPSTCTGSRKNAWRAERVCQRAVQHVSNGGHCCQRLKEEKKRRHLGFLDLCWSPVCAAASCDPAYYFWTQGSVLCEPGQPGGCVVLVNRMWQL